MLIKLKWELFANIMWTISIWINRENYLHFLYKKERMISGNFESVFETEKPENCRDELLKPNNIERLKKSVINLSKL